MNINIDKLHTSLLSCHYIQPHCVCEQVWYG